MARTKNRFNAVAVPEAVSVGAPVKKTKPFVWHFMPDYLWS